MRDDVQVQAGGGLAELKLVLLGVLVGGVLPLAVTELGQGLDEVVGEVEALEGVGGEGSDGGEAGKSAQHGGEVGQL